MLSVGFWLSAVVLSLLAYRVFSSLALRRHNHRQAALHKCLPPPRAPTKGFLGIATLKESRQATRDGRGPIWMHETLNSISTTVHTVKAQLLDYELLITRDSENIKAMLATQSQDFDISPYREKCFKALLGAGVFTNRREMWKHSRGLIRPQFARDNVTDFALFQRHFDAMLRRIDAGRDGWTEVVDMSPLFFNFTLDLSTEFLFGQSVHSQHPEERAKSRAAWDAHAPDIASFGHHLDEAKRIIEQRGALAKYGWLMRDKNFPRHCKAVQDCVDYFVDQRLNATKGGIEAASEKPRFVLLDALAKETQNPVELRCELLNVLHASRDTTASLLGWIFYLLARHADVFERLRDEVVDRLTADPASEMSYSALWSCEYLQFVLNETIRTVAVVPMNERTAVRDTTLPRGGGPDGDSPIFVPAGTQVLLPTYSMQHREDIWGPDVDEFKPERWRGRKFSWDFIPFGGGVRQCIGQQFARTQVMFVVTRMIQMFNHVHNAEGPGPIRMHHTIENRSATGVQVCFHLADPVSSTRLRTSAPQGGIQLEKEHDLGLGIGR